jgi:hypothetical protein
MKTKTFILIVLLSLTVVPARASAQSLPTLTCTESAGETCTQINAYTVRVTTTKNLSFTQTAWIPSTGPGSRVQMTGGSIVYYSGKVTVTLYQSRARTYTVTAWAGRGATWPILLSDYQYMSNNSTLEFDYNGSFSPDITASWDIGGRITNGFAAIPYTTGTWTQETILSTDPYFQNCGSNFMVVDEYGPFEIDPTIEAPLGSGGTPADDQKQTVTTDQIYMVQVSGGPWNDGTDDRYDAAISWDGVTYTKMYDLIGDALCVLFNPISPDLLTLYLVAQSDTFYIRANDEAEQFADNTIPDEESPYIYTLALVFQNPVAPGCEGSYSYDETEDWVASVQVHANEPGVLATDQIVAEEWYVIEIASGEWFDNGVGPRIDMDYAILPTVALPGNYSDLAGGSPGFWCATEDNLTMLVQAKSAPNLYLRVNDDALTFEDNTGTLGVNIYHATFNRQLATCEIQYQLGDMVKEDYISATLENGKLFAESASVGGQVLSYGLTPGAIYVMDTTLGPWGYMGNFHSDLAKSYEMAINDGTSGWMELSEWPGTLCTVPLDGLGHVRIYFSVPSEGAIAYRLRVNDTESWTNNIDGMGYQLYQGIDLGNTPQGACDYTSDPTPFISNLYVASTAEDGAWLQTLDANEIYLLRILAGSHAWQESSGGPDLTGMQITADGGSTWFSLPDNWYGTLCWFEYPNGDIGVFFRTGSNTIGYKVRVDSSSFGDNTGQMYIDLYGAHIGDSINPWTTCLDGLYPSVIDEFEWIPVREAGGVNLASTSVQVNDFWLQLGVLLGGVTVPQTGLLPGQMYMVEIKEGPWTDGETPTDHFDAALSSDNGATWYPIVQDNPLLICGVQDQIGKYWKALFFAEEGETWKIRVNDEVTATFVDNGGNLAFKLYGVLDHPGVVMPEDPIVLDASAWGDVCTTICIRPDSILDLAEWLEYGRCSFQQYIAWCDRHTNLILGLVNAFQGKEPFATLSEINTMIKDAKLEVEGYNWTDGPESILSEGGAQFDSDFQKMLLPETSGGPWDGGDLVNFSQHAQPLSYYTNCSLSMAGALPSKLGQGVCFVSSWFIETGANLWIQLSLDVMAAMAILKMVTSDIKRLINLITGGTAYVK